MKLLINAAVKFLAGIALVGVLLFLPAGSFGYTNVYGRGAFYYRVKHDRKDVWTR